MGKVAIITGGGDGIGYGIATSLAQAGYDLAIWDIRPEVGEAAAQRLAREHGVRTLATATDVASPDQVEAATGAAVEGLGTPYLLVNNAGITRIGRMEDATVADWKAVIDVNLTGVFLCTQSVGRHLVKAGEGAIVNIASVSALTPQVYRPGYSASKAGVVALTQVTALEWGPRGVRCNALSPGQVWTSHSAAVYAVPEMYEERRRQVPLKRIADATEMGTAVVFLASPAASYVNGINLVVDGGLHLTMQGRMPTMGPDGVVVRPEEMYTEATKGPQGGPQVGTATR
jgi:NAD(P)-dependent dehydrogenase (short-subunit alcohol dehydrogenase family)